MVFKFWVVHANDIYGSATELDALWYVNAAKHWYWGSEYSWAAFTRPPAYPLFIAVVHLLRFPLRIGIEVMQMVGYLTLVAGLRRIGLPRTICFACFAVMIFHPASFQLNGYTMADSLYTALLPLTVGGLLLILFTGKLIHATWTGIALAALWNTREESFLIVPMLVAFFGIALVYEHSATGLFKNPARLWLGPSAVMLGVLASLVLAVDAANYRAFHSFSKSDLTSASFQGAYKALLRIRPIHHQRFVSVSSEALEVAYKISPTFAQLKAQFEGDLGHNWQYPAFTALGIHEIGTPWFMWALRSVAANSGDIHRTPSSASRFYRNAAREINRACDEGRVPSRVVLSSFLDPGAAANVRYLPESFLRIGHLFFLRYSKTENGNDAILTGPQSALYDEMTGRHAIHGSPGGLSTAFEGIIGRYHRILLLGLSIAGGAAAWLIARRFRRLQFGDSLNAALVLLATTILLRVAFFTFLDSTWWIGGYERYIFPVAPLYSCFLILLIYQAFATWRTTRNTLSI